MGLQGPILRGGRGGVPMSPPKKKPREEKLTPPSPAQARAEAVLAEAERYCILPVHESPAVAEQRQMVPHEEHVILAPGPGSEYRTCAFNVLTLEGILLPPNGVWEALMRSSAFRCFGIFASAYSR